MGKLGFTLIELLIVVVIVVLLAVSAGIKISSRVRITNLEQAAQILAAEMTQARSSAILKGCATRLIMCADRNCTNTSVVDATKRISNNSVPVVNYAILRMSQPTTGLICPNANAVLTDGYQNWDFDRLGSALPRGIVFTSIYQNAGVLDQTDWFNFTVLAATNSLYFNSSDSNNFPHVPIINRLLDNNGTQILVQLSYDDCDPVTADCLGYLIWIDTTGQVGISKCSGGGRQNNTVRCF